MYACNQPHATVIETARNAHHSEFRISSAVALIVLPACLVLPLRPRIKAGVEDDHEQNGSHQQHLQGKDCVSSR